MTNFKNKILKSLDNEKQLEKTLEEMSKFQQNLLKNQSNPVFNKKDKNTILKSYSDLENLGKSLYRYDTLKQYNLLKDIQAEKENISNTVLKGGISNSRYIWRSEHGENTCEKCLSLDGQEFEFYDEVPERPHPNCRCHVEIVEDDNTNQKPKKDKEALEVCDDCFATLEEFDRVLNEAQTIEHEAVTLLEEYIFFSTTDISQKSKQGISELIDELYQKIFVFAAFLSNYFQLLYLNWNKYHEGSPEYYHQKANCEAAQKGEIAEATAEILGQTREFFDYYKDVYFKGKSIEDAEYNNRYDLEQNQMGRKVGRENPDGDCGEILKGRIEVQWPKK